jgi:hypothetical protein
VVNVVTVILINIKNRKRYQSLLKKIETDEKKLTLPSVVLTSLSSVLSPLVLSYLVAGCLLSSLLVISLKNEDG